MTTILNVLAKELVAIKLIFWRGPLFEIWPLDRCGYMTVHKCHLVMDKLEFALLWLKSFPSYAILIFTFFIYRFNITQKEDSKNFSGPHNFPSCMLNRNVFFKTYNVGFSRFWAFFAHCASVYVVCPSGGAIARSQRLFISCLDSHRVLAVW